MGSAALADYSGTDNLEIMAEAVNYNRFLERLILKHARAGRRIVDFGAGIGTFATVVAKHGFDISCVEQDETQAKVIRKLGIDVRSSLDELASESCDYVYTLNVLEHIEDDRQALSELYRVLKPGGIILVYVPAMQILFSSMDRKVGHYRRYTRKSLIRVSQDAGFTIDQCCYADSLGFPATLFYKLFDSGSGDLSKLPLIIYDRVAFPISRLLDRLLSNMLGKNVFAVIRKNGDRTAPHEAGCS